MKFKYKLLGNISFGNEIQDILRMKGVDNIASFLKPNQDQLEDILLLDNIEAARDKLIFHINNNSNVLIVVDSDTDGYTSAALMYQYIKNIKQGISLDYIIHSDKQHGLVDIYEQLYDSKYDLIIIPDAGTGDINECNRLIEKGKDIIILDHHSISNVGNNAIVVNNQLSHRVMDKSMTGVGIVYKFCKLLDRYYNVNYADKYIDLVSIGMIGDRCNMFNLQCRYLIMLGLNKIQNGDSDNKLIKLLVESQSYSMNNKITVTGIGFYVVPLINSLIRFGLYEDKCYMFEGLCNSEKKLIRKVKGKGEIELSIQEYVVKACESANRKQKKSTEDSVEKLIKDIEENKLNEYPILVCNARDNVDYNSTGLIANKLVSQYQKPCLLLRRKGDLCSGSGRGYEKCDIEDFNKWCKSTELFEMIDGHPNAFGAKIRFENTYKLYQLISTLKINNECLYHVYGIYDNTTLNDTIIKRIASYDYLWGSGVDEPLFLINNITCNKYNINLLGSKQNKIEFIYRNIKFTMYSKSSLSSIYNEIITLGETIKFTIIGSFRIDNKIPQVMITDLMYEKSDKIVGFGF